MGKNSFLKNIYIRNLLGLILISVLLLFVVLTGLKRYTQHGEAVEVPDVKGISVENAEPFFTNKNLSFAIIDSVFIKNATPGSILETIPPVGSMVKQGRTIYLKVTTYQPQLIAIPDVKDVSQRQSMAMLRSLGFENVDVKLVPGIYKDLALGIECRGVSMETGQRVPANMPLTLLVSFGSDDILLLENPVDSVEVSIDELWL